MLMRLFLKDKGVILSDAKKLFTPKAYLLTGKKNRKTMSLRGGATKLSRTLQSDPVQKTHPICASLNHPPFAFGAKRVGGHNLHPTGEKFLVYFTHTLINILRLYIQ